MSRSVSGFKSELLVMSHHLLHVAYMDSANVDEVAGKSREMAFNVSVGFQSPSSKQYILLDIPAEKILTCEKSFPCYTSLI